MKNTIRAFLDERGITPYRFYKEVGIAPRTAYDLCNNPDQLPASTVLAKICDTYEVQPGDLLVWVKKADTTDQAIEGDATDE